MFCNASNRRQWYVHLPFNFVRIFVDVQSTFMTADELLHKFDVFRNSDVRTDRGRPLHFGRSVTPVDLIIFSSRSWSNSYPKNFSTNVVTFSSSPVFINTLQLARYLLTVKEIPIDDWQSMKNPDHRQHAITFFLSHALVLPKFFIKILSLLFDLSSTETNRPKNVTSVFGDDKLNYKLRISQQIRKELSASHFTERSKLQKTFCFR